MTGQTPGPASSSRAQGTSGPTPEVDVEAGRPETTPSWQLRPAGSRLGTSLRRAPVGRAASPVALTIGRRAVVPDLATSIAHPRDVRVTSRALMAGTTPASPVALRRQVWSASSIVLRQAAGARTESARLARTHPSGRTDGPGPRAASQPDPSGPGAQADAPADRSSAESAATVASDKTPDAAPETSSHTPPANTPEVPGRLPVAAHTMRRLWRKTTEIRPVTDVGAALSSPVLREAPGATAPASHTAPSGHDASSGTTTQSGTPPVTVPARRAWSPASAPGLPRLWRKATEVRPATDTRAGATAPFLRWAPSRTARTAAPPAGPAGTAGPVPVRRTTTHLTPPHPTTR